MRSIRFYVFFSFMAIVVWRDTFVAGEEQSFQGIEEKDNFVTSEFTKILPKCRSENGLIGVVNCAAMRMLKFMSRAADQTSISLLPGISFVSENNTNMRTGRELLKNVELPKDSYKKMGKLLDLIVSSAKKVFYGRKMAIDLPKLRSESVARAFEEGRGKIKKVMGPLMLGIGTKMMTVVPALITAVGLLSTKALIVSKVALVVSAVIVIQYIITNLHITSTPPIPPFGLPGYGPNGPSWSSNSIGGYGYGGYGPIPVGPGPYARSIEAERKGDYSNIQKTAYSSVS